MIQNKCKLIGLTGGIATGKSTVANILMEMNFNLIDADKIAREVVEVNKPAYNKIVETFGKEILLEDGQLNRKALGKIIFRDGELREKLNRITHPYIFESIKNKIEIAEKKSQVLFLDIPLLFEQFDKWKDNNIFFDDIWLVYLKEDLQIKRLMKRDDISLEEAIARIGSQINIEEKKTMSSKIIDNSGELDDLEKQIKELLAEFN